nr:NAD-dependent succinate-semialdehyde dehydrogenase [Sphingomonas sp.]
MVPSGCLIGDTWVTNAEMIDVRNPADGTLVGQVPSLGAAHTQQAIDAAALALPGWAARTANERAEILMRFHALILGHESALAALLTAEQGKPLSEAVGEIRYAARFIEWFAEEGKRIDGRVICPEDADKRILAIKQPVGVVAAITPWNFPAAMVTRKVGPALAAGCTVILKPAELTPLTALALGALARQAGLPDGVLNIITGDPATIGKVLTASPVVRKLSFTGSTATGALLYAQCAPTVKKLSLELGGNAPFIVFDDADIEAAVVGAIQSKFRNAGQTCVCANRFYVQAGVYDEFVGSFSNSVSRLRVGAGDIEGNQIGPLIDEAAIAKVERHIADATDKGARVTTGGARHPSGPLFFTPTVLADANGTMLATQEETFGPVAPVIRFDTEAEMIAHANHTPFGLAAYFYTRDITRVWRVAEAVEAGMIGVNTGLISTAVAPFGGVKSSGLGREGAREGIEEYLETKMVCMAL